MGYSLEQQLELEREMLDAGINRFRRVVDDAVGKGRETHTLHGRTMIATVVGAVAEGVKQVQDTPTSNRDVAYIALVSMVDGISKAQALVKVAKNIGGNIEMQDRLEKWIEAEGTTARNTIKKANEKGTTARRYGLTNKMNKDGYKHLAWTGDQRIQVGMKLVDVIIRNT